MSLVPPRMTLNVHYEMGVCIQAGGQVQPLRVKTRRKDCGTRGSQDSMFKPQKSGKGVNCWYYFYLGANEPIGEISVYVF